MPFLEKNLSHADVHLFSMCIHLEEALAMTVKNPCICMFVCMSARMCVCKMAHIIPVCVLLTGAHSVAMTMIEATGSFHNDHIR